MSLSIPNESLGTNVTYYLSASDEEATQSASDEESTWEIDVIDRSDSGSPQENNTLTNEWPTFNGNLVIEGEAVNGLPVGPFQYIDSNGQLREGYFGTSRRFQTIPHNSD